MRIRIWIRIKITRKMFRLGSGKRVSCGRKWRMEMNNDFPNVDRGGGIWGFSIVVFSQCTTSNLSLDSSENFRVTNSNQKDTKENRKTQERVRTECGQTCFPPRPCPCPCPCQLAKGSTKFDTGAVSCSSQAVSDCCKFFRILSNGRDIFTH